MRSAALLLTLIMPCAATAQVMDGFVQHADTRQPLAGVNVVNKRSHAGTSTDSAGRFSLHCARADTIIFSYTGFSQDYRIMGNDNYSAVILLRPRDYRLKETIVKGLTRYQQDSLARHLVYDHELTRVLVAKPDVSLGGGIGLLSVGCTGCIGWLADKITGNSKAARRFRARFALEDETKFVDSRYTPQLVTTLTGLREPDSIATFMNANPMEYAFAREATDLELKSWIRERYREYIRRKGEQ